MKSEIKERIGCWIMLSPFLIFLVFSLCTDSEYDKLPKLTEQYNLLKKAIESSGSFNNQIANDTVNLLGIVKKFKDDSTHLKNDAQNLIDGIQSQITELIYKRLESIDVPAELIAAGQGQFYDAVSFKRDDFFNKSEKIISENKDPMYWFPINRKLVFWSLVHKDQNFARQATNALPEKLLPCLCKSLDEQSVTIVYITEDQKELVGRYVTSRFSSHEDSEWRAYERHLSIIFYQYPEKTFGESMRLVIEPKEIIGSGKVNSFRDFDSDILVTFTREHVWPLITK